MNDQTSERYGNWRIQRMIAEGGGGKVFLATDTGQHDADQIVLDTMEQLLAASRVTATLSERRNNVHALLEAIRAFVLPPESANGALKVPHRISEAKEAEVARTRLRKEVEAMQVVSHPALVKIRDVDSAANWFVMDYLPGGTLDDRKGNFTGQPHKALIALRPIVEAIAAIHKAHHVHRDIKTKNIFCRGDGGLVLGDFGIVWTRDDDRTRLTNPDQTLCSRDWIPPWLKYREIEDYRPSCDVHMLAKVLYVMISTQKNIDPSQLDDPDFDIRKLFPQKSHSHYINAVHDLFRKTIVSHERNCLSDGETLLGEFDRILGDGNRDEADLPAQTGPGISKLAREILVSATKDKNGSIIRIDTLGGMRLQTNGESFVTTGDPRSEAQARAAINELENANLIALHGPKIFMVTAIGYAFVDSLANPPTTGN